MDESERKTLEEKLRREIAQLAEQEKILKKKDMDLLQQQEELLGQNEVDSVSSSIAPSYTPLQSTPAVRRDYDKNDVLESVTYILFDDGEKSKRLFASMISKEKPGLLISRTNPKILQKKFDLSNVKICWLSKMRASDDIKSVSGLQEISILISSYIEEHPTSMIILDGIDYLISNNDFNIVLRLVQTIRDKVSTSNSVLLIPINPEILEEKQATLLKNECEPL